MSSPYIGEIRMVGFNFAPQDWALCNGQLLAISDNEALFALIGTTYGGDGQNNFALPNLQSRVPLHMGTSSEGIAYIEGQTGGGESVTLTAQQLPAHTHAAECNSTAANSATPNGNFWANWADQQFSDQTTPAAPLNPAAVGNAGGSTLHDNMLPFQVINFIISLFGIFPSQS